MSPAPPAPECGGIPASKQYSFESNEVFTFETDRLSFLGWAGTAYHDYVYFDLGAGALSGDFNHDFNFYVYSYDEVVKGYWWGVSNEIGSNNQHTGNRIIFGYDGDLVQWVLREYYNDGANTAQVTRNYSTSVLYARVTRDESIGSFGRITITFYTDSARTVVFDTMVLDLHEKNDFRYRYLIMSDGGNELITSADLSGEICIPIDSDCCTFAPRTFAPGTEVPSTKVLPMFKTCCDFKGQLIIGNLIVS